MTMKLVFVNHKSHVLRWRRSCWFCAFLLLQELMKNFWNQSFKTLLKNFWRMKTWKERFVEDSWSCLVMICCPVIQHGLKTVSGIEDLVRSAYLTTLYLKWSTHGRHLLNEWGSEIPTTLAVLICASTSSMIQMMNLSAGSSVWFNTFPNQIELCPTVPGKVCTTLVGETSTEDSVGQYAFLKSARPKFRGKFWRI